MQLLLLLLIEGLSLLYVILYLSLLEDQGMIILRMKTFNRVK